MLLVESDQKNPRFRSPGLCYLSSVPGLLILSYSVLFNLNGLTIGNFQTISDYNLLAYIEVAFLTSRLHNF